MKKYSYPSLDYYYKLLIIPFKATAIENNSDDDMTNIIKHVILYSMREDLG